ncbi:hypothetical protein EGW08_003142 [Elysia chlorotica]|uniref:Sushi domain-containing protein n=1 Tax=Elysia chlorotica TaxID=188477 RepID=A0A433U5Q2_ELYCH|nr:hypothetical protein EGW08_003142 [Elysia chlorotica]
MKRDGVGSVFYTCAQGYFQTGINLVSTCEGRSKGWSAVDIKCTLVDCGAPPTVFGAMSTGSRTTADAEVSYTCLAGSIPTSPVMTSTCVGQSGQWSPEPGPCTEVSCGPPPPVNAMDVELTTVSAEGAFPGLTNLSLPMAYGGEAVYTCQSQHGYTQPDGASYTSLCQADGTWRPTSEFQCTLVECGQPPPVDNSNVNFTAVTFGSKATVTCMPGFSPVETLTFTCNANATWEGPEVTCEMVKCAEPPVLENATVVYNSTDVAATAEYKCVEPALKEHEENSTTQCMENGKWSAVGLVCITIPCGLPPPVDHSQVSLYAVGDLIFADYVCNEGFVAQASQLFNRYVSYFSWSIGKERIGMRDKVELLLRFSLDAT